MKNSGNYKTDVLAQNAMLNEEFKSIGGAVKSLVFFEGLNENNRKSLRQLAGGKSYQSSAGRNNIAIALTNFAKSDNAQIMRKSNKKEREQGAGEYVVKTTFSAFWVLQQLHKMRVRL